MVRGCCISISGSSLSRLNKFHAFRGLTMTETTKEPKTSNEVKSSIIDPLFRFRKKLLNPVLEELVSKTDAAMNTHDVANRVDRLLAVREEAKGRLSVKSSPLEAALTRFAQVSMPVGIVLASIGTFVASGMTLPILIGAALTFLWPRRQDYRQPDRCRRKLENHPGEDQQRSLHSRGHRPRKRLSLLASINP